MYPEVAHNKVLLSQRENAPLRGRRRWRSGAPKHGAS